jgi:hypothetical protein
MEGLSRNNDGISKENESVKDYSGKHLYETSYAYAQPASPARSLESKKDTFAELPKEIKKITDQYTSYRQAIFGQEKSDPFLLYQKRKTEVALLKTVGVAEKMEEVRDTLRRSGKHGRIAADYQELINKVVGVMSVERKALSIKNGEDFYSVQKMLYGNPPLQAIPYKGESRFSKEGAVDAVIIEQKDTPKDVAVSDPWERLRKSESSRFGHERPLSTIEQPKNLERIKDTLHKRKENTLNRLKSLNLKAAPVALLETFNKISPRKKLACGVVFAGASVATGGALAALSFGLSTTSFASHFYKRSLTKLEKSKSTGEILTDKEKQKAALRAFIFGAGASAVTYFGIKEISEAVGPLYEKLQNTFNGLFTSSPSTGVPVITAPLPVEEVLTSPPPELLSELPEEVTSPLSEPFVEVSEGEEAFDAAKAEARNGVYEAYERTRNQIYNAYEAGRVTPPTSGTNIAEEIMKSRQETLANIEEARRAVLRPRGM